MSFKEYGQGVHATKYGKGQKAIKKKTQRKLTVYQLFSNLLTYKVGLSLNFFKGYSVAYVLPVRKVLPVKLMRRPYQAL